MKKLINRPEAVVEEMVEGLVATYPGLSRLPEHPVVVRAEVLGSDPAGRRVALISGGGSGHEPAHAGYVGRGMLDAAVAGPVFTSPSPDAVLAAIRAVAGAAGALLIVKNYTGDRLNFGLAAERARAEGLEVATVAVADDVALAATGGHAGRRGLAGTILVHKVAGAAAAAGAGLEAVRAEAAAAAAAVATMGVALSPCTIPLAGRPGFDLGPDEIELGLGIHGEPGARRGPLEPADAVVDQLLGAIRGDLGLGRGDRVALLVNNLGGTAAMELAIVARRALAVLEGEGIAVERAYVGTFLSALEMAGVSLSLLRVDDGRLARLDAATDAPAWPAPGATRPRLPRATPRTWPAGPSPAPASAPQGPPRTRAGRRLEQALRAACRAVLDAAPRLDELDRAVGDGDLGTSLRRGALAVVDSLPTCPLDDPAAALHALGLVLQASLGGTSGPLYAALFLRASATLRAATAPDARAWADALRAGGDAIAALGDARGGDRTMLDALLPASDAFHSSLDARSSSSDAIRRAADAANAGADATAGMDPRRGRSSYLGERALGHPDPGAVAVAIWFGALAALDWSADDPASATVPAPQTPAK